MDGHTAISDVQMYSTMITPTQAEESESQPEHPLSEDGKHRVLPEQGLQGVNRPAPINLDCWPAFRDKDEDTEVFFAVYKPVLPRQTARDLHWSLAWPIRDTYPAAWRQIHVIEERVEAEAGTWDSRYVYWGPLTKSSGPTDDVAERYSLGAFSLEWRKNVEELAAVVVPDGTRNCQDWLLDLFERMITERLISSEKRDDVLAAAGHVSA